GVGGTTGPRGGGGAGTGGGRGAGGDAEQQTRRWHAARQTFPLRVEPKLQELATRWEPAAPEGFDRPPDPQRALLDRVAEVCEARYSNPVVHHIDGSPPYLRVTYKKEDYTQQIRIGACVDAVSVADLDAFLSRVRPAEANFGSELVYEGTPAPPDVREYAKQRGVRLRSFTELQGLLDLRDYVTAQTERLQSDHHYPPEFYVPQRYRDLTGADRDVRDGLVDQLLALLGEDDGRFVLLLGDFGRGKTF